MKKILVVEDNESFRRNTIEILSLSGFELAGSANGKAAIQTALEFLPDLILCDIDLPGLDGFGVLAILRKSKSLKNVLFIFMTGIPENQDFRKAMNLGADDFIRKPFTGAELLRIINTRFDRLSDFIAKNGFDDQGSLTDQSNHSEIYPLFSRQPATLLKKGDQLYRAGQQISFIPYMLEGRVRTTYTDYNGKELTTEIVNPGQFVGIANFITRTTWSEDAYAMEEVLVNFIPGTNLKKAIEENHRINQNIQRQLAQALCIKKEELFINAYQNLRGKIALVFLNLEVSAWSEELEEIRFKITRNIIATIAGVAKESAVRTIIDFIDEGLIEESRKGFRILNHSKLEALAGRTDEREREKAVLNR